ncbi:hypothetical protein BD779DRAFT_1560568 [Infundibulicybe gibba]|nr:hypothetical protein BD779DRAFT_1560568 [Infundibulicybe gibba]
MALNAWDSACTKLELDDEEPELEQLRRIRDRISQFRGQLKAHARTCLPSAFGFVSIQTLRDPTPEQIASTMASNRQKVSDLKETFWYTTPENTKIPDSMYRNPIIQNLLNVHWFGDGTHNRAFYFSGLSLLPLITIALILSAVACAIDEWKTGRFVGVGFERTHYAARFNRFLKTLQQWKEFSATQDHDLATELQTDLLRNARATMSSSPDSASEDGDVDDAARMAAFTANQV